MSLVAIVAVLAAFGFAASSPVPPATRLDQRCEQKQRTQVCMKQRRVVCKKQRGATRRREARRRGCPRPGPKRRPPVLPAPIPIPIPIPPAPQPAPAPVPAPTATPAPLPSRTGVDLNEYSLVPAYGSLAAGSVELNATNFGMDEHNLTVDSPAGAIVGQVDLPAAGGTGTLALTLSAGDYKLYCSLFDHDALGMNAVLTVR